MQDPKNRQKFAIWAPSHNCVGLYFATKACVDNRKKLLNSNVFPTCPHKMVNFGPLAAEICWRVWGTPANFNGFRVLAALLHGIEQRAPPIFGRAAITLLIGPHSSYRYSRLFLSWTEQQLMMRRICSSTNYHKLQCVNTTLASVSWLISASFHQRCFIVH